MSKRPDEERPDEQAAGEQAPDEEAAPRPGILSCIQKEPSARRFFVVIT